ncbi:MAG: hypothetical protein IMF05_05395 [Proteobacteria bacterium]|nr:hypothetical protein [Pseudomonadota bacterium]
MRLAVAVRVVGHRVIDHAGIGLRVVEGIAVRISAIIATVLAATVVMPTAIAVIVTVALVLVPPAVVVAMVAVHMPRRRRTVPAVTTAVAIAVTLRVLRIVARLFLMFATMFAGSGLPYWRRPAVMPVVTVVDLPASLFDIAGAGRRILVRQPALMLGLRCRGSRQYAGHQRDRSRANGQFRSDSRGTCQHDFLHHW